MEWVEPKLLILCGNKEDVSGVPDCFGNGSSASSCYQNGIGATGECNSVGNGYA